MKQCPIDGRWKPHVHSSEEIFDFIESMTKENKLFAAVRRKDGNIEIYSVAYEKNKYGYVFNFAETITLYDGDSIGIACDWREDNGTGNIDEA